jgi:hypothetical protein
MHIGLGMTVTPSKDDADGGEVCATHVDADVLSC